MFFAEDRVPIMQHMILARTREERERYLAQLLPLQKQDVIGLDLEMKGLPVTIRLLDPPLHEFLPKREELMVEIARLELMGGNPALVEEKRRLLARVEELHEFNPMLGLRGCRLGITMPEITRMQTRAILEAACEVTREGKKIVPEIMIPLVGMVSEMKAQKDLIREVAEETMRRRNVKLDRKSTRLNSSHTVISYAVFCLKKKKLDPTGTARQAAVASAVASCGQPV